MSDLEEVMDHDGKVLPFRSAQLNLESAIASCCVLPLVIVVAPITIALDVTNGQSVPHAVQRWAKSVVEIALSIPKDLCVDAPRHLLAGLTARK